MRKIWYSPELIKAKAVLAEANSRYDKLTSLWGNAASARQWAIDVETRQNAISEATKLANLLLATDAERTGFVLAFLADPFDTLKQFVADAEQQIEKALTVWRDFAQTPAGTTFFRDMTSITGLDADWLYEFEVSPLQFRDKLIPGSNLDFLDARVTSSGLPAAEFDTGTGFADAIRTALPDMFNYHHTSPYRVGLDSSGNYGKFEGGHEAGLPGLAATLESDPSVRVLALHGYYDLLTPFYQTELDLAAAGLAGSVPVKTYEGGHMVFSDDKARVQSKKALDLFYDGLPTGARKPSVVLH